MIALVAAGLAALAVLAGLLAYGLAAHRFSITDDRSAGSYLFAIVSIFGVLLFTALINKAWWAAAAITAGGTGFGWWFWQQAQLSTTWIYLVQHAGAHGALAVLFGSSLVPGRTPLVSRMAALVHGSPSGQRDHYTRQVTWAWTLYFAVISLTSTGLYLTDHMLAWSWLANILTIPLLLGMFIIEFIVRRFRLTAAESGRLSDGWLAYQRMRDEDNQQDGR